MNLLLVDDSATMRALQVSALQAIGHTNIQTASSGDEALDKVGMNPPDLILVDADMPGMDGLSFVEQFRKLDRRTPVIVLTAQNQRSRMIDAMRAGADNYLYKPFTPDLARQRINEVMADRAAA